MSKKSIPKDQQLVQDGIEQISYIVSTTGSTNIKAGKDRGNPVPISANTSALDALSKVFNKGAIGYNKDTYTAIIEDPTTGNLYLSFQGTPPKMGLKGGEVAGLYDSLGVVVGRGNINDKMELFNLMLKNGNPIIHHLKDDYQKEIDQQVSSLDPKDLEFANQKESLLKKKNDLQSFVEAKFDQFLSNEDITAIGMAGLDRRNIEIAPHDPQNPEHYGVHVEAKGLAYARDRNPEARVFNVGLSSGSSKNDLPGCCAGCSAEFNTLGQEGYKINRTADFPSNFPGGGYVPSANVTRDSATFQEFATNLNEACKVNATNLPVKTQQQLNEQFQKIDIDGTLQRLEEVNAIKKINGLEEIRRQLSERLPVYSSRDNSGRTPDGDIGAPPSTPQPQPKKQLDPNAKAFVPSGL